MKTKTIELRHSGSSSGTYPFLLFLNNEYDFENAYDGFSVSPLFRTGLTFILGFLFVKHTKDVEMENKKEWYKFWEHIL